jgi:hypothetical protein
MTDEQVTHRRPRDLAILLLAGEGAPPRTRARDQRADQVGAELRREILVRLSAADPDPSDIEAALARIVEEVGEPSGAVRAVASSVLRDWRESFQPAFWSWLVSEAVTSDRGRAKGP